MKKTYIEPQMNVTRLSSEILAFVNTSGEEPVSYDPNHFDAKSNKLWDEFVYKPTGFGDGKASGVVYTDGVFTYRDNHVEFTDLWEE